MKKAELCWTPFALSGLEDIKKYITQETQSETIAVKYINKLINRVEQLEIFPDSGVKESLLKHLKQNSRYIIEGNYKIIYQYKDDKVIITDVFHTKQTPIKITKRNTHQ
jgi:toxin ParE1/3/4